MIIIPRVAAPATAAYFTANSLLSHTNLDTHTSQPQDNAINRRIANTIVQISTILYFGGVISGSPARIRTWVSRSRVSNDGPLHYGAEHYSAWFGA